MIRGGYILQPRKFDQSETAHMPPVVRELWLYLLRMVNHSNCSNYKRGQGFFNLSDIQDDLCWYVGYRKETYSKPQLTKALRRLREGNMVETMKATRGVVVTIINYNYYQNPENYESNDEGNTKETRRKRGGHTKNKNVKNEKNDEERIIGGDDDFFDMRELNALAVKHLGWKPVMTPGRAESLRQLTSVFKADVIRGFEAATAAGATSINYVVKAAAGPFEKEKKPPAMSQTAKGLAVFSEIRRRIGGGEDENMAFRGNDAWSGEDVPVQIEVLPSGRIAAGADPGMVSVCKPDELEQHH